MSSKEGNSWVLVGKDGRTHDLSHGMIFIGREECDIVLQAASADKRHAVLCFNNSERKFHIKDLNSLTGTYVNGHRIPEQTYVKLKRLDCIRFGYGPDVFYLEKSSSGSSPPREEPLKSPGPETPKNSPEDCSEAVMKPEVDEVPEQSASKGSDNPNHSREDHPPDSLSLNLSSISARSQDKEWDWIGQDGTLSDSPDYSQRSETSSCSAPPNYSMATAEDHRDNGSAHSSPAATAFTIAFETEASTPRKKLGIRDSISKFAPAKSSDSEGRVSFQKSSKSEAAAPLHRSSRSEPGPFQKSVRADPSPKKLPIPDGKALPTKSKTQVVNKEIKDLNEEIGKIAESTSFLINRMLNGEMSPSDIPAELTSKENTNHSSQNDITDDRSEAGTYTVEAEEPNCDVEEARKKIDEVFGVIQLSNSVLTSSFSSNTSSSSNKQVTIPRLNGRLKQNERTLKGPVTVKPRESPMQWNSSSKPYGRTRGQGPTPAASTESLNHSDSLPRSLQRTRKVSDPTATPERIRRSTKLASSTKSPAKDRTPSTLKSPGSLSNNLSAAPSNPIQNKEITRRRSTDTRSEGSKSPHTGTQWQKVPWNLSGSDLDLDRSKSENNSILSDTSTEPSSHSSHSGQGRADQGPTMRLNRAFALRRARLESEGTKRGKENRTSSTSGQPHSMQKASMKKSSKLSSSTSTLRDECSSSGGSSSKINYRPGPPVSKPFVGRQVGQSTDPLKRKIMSSHNMEDYQSRGSNKEITALDSLVISAIHQLASKLWSNSKELLEKERKKCPKGSDTWLMIDEVLPQVPVTSTPEDGDFTKDLSSILKNLKRVEQGLDVLSSILENGREPEPGVEEKPAPLPQNFFVVNM